jgi:hypothetical protein
MIVHVEALDQYDIDQPRVPELGVGVEGGALWLPESDPYDLAAQKRDAETPQTPKRRNAETPNHDHRCHAHAFGRSE